MIRVRGKIAFFAVRPAELRALAKSKDETLRALAARIRAAIRKARR